MEIKMKHRKIDNPLYYRLLYTKQSMMGRCYNKNNPKYHNYGGRGVTVCDKWKKISGFIEDADKIDGWDKDRFLAGELRLDKDKKNIENKHYSVENCSWITNAENSKYKPNAMKKSVAIDPQGKKYEFYNSTDFADKHGLNKICILQCLYQQDSHHKHWRFYYKKDGKPKPRKVFVATRGETSIRKYHQSTLADELGIPAKKLYEVLSKRSKNPEYDGWVFHREFE